MVALLVGALNFWNGRKTPLYINKRKIGLYSIEEGMEGSLDGGETVLELGHLLFLLG